MVTSLTTLSCKPSISAAAWKHAAVAVWFLAGTACPLVACAQAQPVSHPQPVPAQQEAAVTATRLAQDPGLVKPRDEAGLRLLWALEISAPDQNVTGFRDYALPFSRVRLDDGRSLALAFYPSTISAAGIRTSRFFSAAEEAADAEAMYRQPRNPPAIPGMEFVDGYRIASGPRAPRSVGLWRKPDGSLSLVAFDEDEARAFAPVVLADVSGNVQVVSGSAQLHGGPTLVSFATQPDATGRFRIATYEWRR